MFFKKTILLLVVSLAFFVIPQGAHAAIGFRGSAMASSSPSTDTTVSFSGISGLAQNDLVIVAASMGDNDNLTTLDMINNSAGWTEMNTVRDTADVHDVHLTLWYKFMGASPDADVVIEGTGPGTDGSLAVVVMAFSGVDTTTPFDVASTSATGISSPHADPPSIDHNNPSGVWTVIAGAAGHILAGGCTFTFPAGYTTNAKSGSRDDTFDTTVGLGYRSSGGSDPEDPGAMTHSCTLSVDNAWAAFTMALRPATAPTVTTQDASSIGETSATFNGNITVTGGISPTVRGFAWGTSAIMQGDTATTTDTAGAPFGTGAFTDSAQTLVCGTTYYYRPYAVNTIGTSSAPISNSFSTSACPIATISGTLYNLNEVTQNTIAGRTIMVRVGTSTAGIFSTTTIAANGVWRIQNIALTGFHLGMPIHAWVDNDVNYRAFTFTKASSTVNDISGVDLMQNRVTIKHEGFTATSTTNADLAAYDADDEDSLQFKSVAAGALNVYKSQELRIAPGTEFKPGGAVTLHGNASTTNPDGDLRLMTGLRQNGVATSSILTMPGGNNLTLAGNWFASSTAVFSGGFAVHFNSTSTQQKIIMATSTPFPGLSFYNDDFAVPGYWTFGDYSATTTGAFAIGNLCSCSLVVTAPSGTLTIGGSMQKTHTADAFSHNSGTLIFNGAGSIGANDFNGTSALNNVIFRGAAGKSFSGNNASTTNFTIEAGSGAVNAPWANLSISGNYSNSSTFTHRSGTVYFNGSSAQTISGTMTGTSAFASTTFVGAGTKTFSNNASTTNLLTIQSGATVIAPTYLTVGGNYTQNGSFTDSSGTVYFSSTTAQTISGTLNTATTDFASTTFIGAATKTFSSNASTTRFAIETGATVVAPSLLSIAGNYANSGTFTGGSGTVYATSSSQQTFSGTMIGTSAFNNLTIQNTSGTGATQSIIFSASASTTGTMTMLASTSAQFLAGSTQTFTNIDWNGGTAATRIWLRSSSAGSAWNLINSGTQSVSYVDVKDSNACSGNSVTATDSFDSTGNSCWSFPSLLTFSGTLYGMQETNIVTGVSKTIKLAIGTSTPGVYTTTSNSGDGTWSLSETFAPFLGQPFLAWVDGDSTFRAATFTKASSTANSIPKIDLMQNRLVIKHEGFTATSTTNADLAFYDADDNDSIQFTSVAAGALNVFKSQELHIAPGTEFKPGGTITLHGNASTTNPDGDLHLPTGLRQNGVATSSILTMSGDSLTLAGNWFASSTAIFQTLVTVTFNSTSSQQKVVIATSTPFTALSFSSGGIFSGSWTFGQYAATTSSLTVANASTLTAPSTEFAIAGNLLRTSTGSFIHNSGTVILNNTSGSQNINSSMTGTSAFNNVIIRGAGTKSFLANPASTTNFTIEAGSGAVTAPSTNLTISGNYSNSGTFTHNRGTVYFDSGSAQSISGVATGTSSFASTTFTGAGTKTFSSNASTTNLFTIQSGASVIAPTLLTVGGNYTQNGSFTDSSGTVYFSSTTDQTIAGTMNSATTDFASVEFLGSGTKTFSNSASSTNFTVGSGVTLAAPSLLSIGGNYINNGDFTDGSGTLFFSGTGGQALSGTMTGSTDDFASVVFTGAGTKSFGANAASTTNFTIQSGSGAVTAPSTLLTISGNYSNAGTFTQSAGTTTFDGAGSQNISGTLVGSSPFNHLEFLGAGTKTFGSNASSTNFFIRTGSGTVTAPSGYLSIAGNYRNLGTFTAGTGTTTFNGTSFQRISGVATGTSAFYNLEIANTSATTSFTVSASSTNNFYAVLPLVKLEFLAGATSTFQNLLLNGQSASNEIRLWSGTPGSRWNIHVPGTRTVFYTSVMDSSACSSAGDIDASNGTNVNAGNNVCWTFIPPAPILDTQYYRWRDDDGTEVSASYLQTQNNPLTSGIYVGDRTRLRFSIANTGNAAATNYTYRLEHSSSTNPGTWLSVANLNVNDGTHFTMDETGQYLNNASTTHSSGLSVPAGKDFTAGYAKSTGNQTGAQSLSTSQYTELEYSIHSTQYVAANVVYSFRLTHAGSTANFVYTVTPELTVQPAKKRPSGGGNNAGGENNGVGPQQGGGNQGGGQSGGSEEGGGGGSQQGGGGAGGGGGGDSE